MRKFEKSWNTMNFCTFSATLDWTKETSGFNKMCINGSPLKSFQVKWSGSLNIAQLYHHRKQEVLHWTERKKTKVMVVTKKKEDPLHPVIMAGYTRRENFEKFRNLGTTFNWNAKSDSKSYWPKLSTVEKSILRQKSLSSDVRRKILVAYVFTMAT